MGKTIVVTGPSGGGKTTLIKRLIKENEYIRFSVSHTTRDMREGEEDGVDYHFVDTDTFNQMISDGKFIEWANVHNSMYGTAFSEVEKVKKSEYSVILDIDVQGAMTLQDKGTEAIYIFIKPPSVDALKERLLQRKSEDEETINLRLWNAKRELEYIDKFDALIVNDEIEKAYADFSKTVNDYINPNGGNK